MTSVDANNSGLSVLHQRLETHFLALRNDRDRSLGSGVPIFALEHGLEEAELALLQATVRDAVKRRYLPSTASLPFVIYAAEVGYEYCGDEYWQTFGAQTPGWAALDNRGFIRTIFQQFAGKFGGARPSGRWADHFTIICWPITHAVLPTDLQQQLVQLMFEYRMGLTADLLADPSALGARLAARSGRYSARFQYFAQNTELLGQVAAALLAPENEESPYLLDSTLERIVQSLSVHRQARMWLRDAKSSANQVRTRGFRPPERERPTGTTGRDRPRLPRATDPGIVLKLVRGGWEARLCLPDLSELAERLPNLYENLGRLRIQLAGMSGAPLARRRLLVPGLPVAIQEWPNPQTPLLQFEDDGRLKSANRLLAEQCVMSAGPAWLFRIREPGYATEVRGKFVRPGHSYVVITRAALPIESLPQWITPSSSVTSGIAAYEMNPPAVLGDEAIAALRTLGIGVVADIEVRPAGLVPGGWDGEGAAQWLAGEDVILCIRSTRAVGKCALAVDGDVTFVDWPQADQEIFVALSGLGLGEHELQIALLPEEVDTAVASGSLAIEIRAPQARPSTGTLREGLMVLTNPVTPTLSELWDGRATVEVLGPIGASASVTATLERAIRVALVNTRFKVDLPVDSTSWFKVAAKEIRGSRTLQASYDNAEALVLTISHPTLGSTELRCEREFTPLRWVVGQDREGPYAQLVNNVDGANVQVARYDFATPAKTVPLVGGSDERLRWPAGGLFRAQVNDFGASVVLPANVRDLRDLQRTRVVPRVSSSTPTPDRVVHFVYLSDIWASASLPGNPFAQHERRAVLRALTARLVSIIAGGRWSEIEDRGTRHNDFTFSQMQEGVGKDKNQRGLAEAIQRNIVEWETLPPAKRATKFAAVLSHRTQVDRNEHQFAEFLLRLASEPSSLASWPKTKIHEAAERVLISPVLIRAARFLVLAVHLDESDDTGAPYEGWEWS